MKTGLELIADERQEQIGKHGWDASHDDSHTKGEIGDAAVTLLTSNVVRNFPDGWHNFANHALHKTWKQKLIIAGALIAAEIDRLNRAGKEN